MPEMKEPKLKLTCRYQNCEGAAAYEWEVETVDVLQHDGVRASADLNSLWPGYIASDGSVCVGVTPRPGSEVEVIAPDGSRTKTIAPEKFRDLREMGEQMNTQDQLKAMKNSELLYALLYDEPNYELLRQECACRIDEGTLDLRKLGNDRGPLDLSKVD
jgi:hypothetical protein